MRQFTFIAAGILFASALAGCGIGPTRPTKTVQVPDGGPPVLTSTERAAKELEAKRSGREFVAQQPDQPGFVSQASYIRPIDAPTPLKPFEMWTEQDAASDALGRIGSAAVPSLIETLNSPDPAVRQKAIEVLGRMGSAAEPAVPDLIRLLDDTDPEVRKAAARTLGRIGPNAEAAVPALMRTLFETTPPSQTIQ
jgi:HEAT repeat protein